MEATRFNQFGYWQGQIQYDGRSCAIDPRRVYGTKDRSWGVRPVGTPAPSAPPTRVPQIFFGIVLNPGIEHTRVFFPAVLSQHVLEVLLVLPQVVQQQPCPRVGAFVFQPFVEIFQLPVISLDAIQQLADLFVCHWVELLLQAGRPSGTIVHITFRPHREIPQAVGGAVGNL